MEALLDFSRPIDVGLVDRIWGVMTNSSNADERRQAEHILIQFREHPDSWTRVDTILELSQNVHSKILEPLIAQRWKILPREQCEGIKNFIVGLIIKLSSDERVMADNAFLLQKLDLTLVQILKQDWPKNWPTFIPDVVGSSKTNETLCENNMVIFRILSEEIFDFSAEQMTSQKVKDLKAQMCNEFAQIFQLCILVLESATKPSLIKVTLNTLLRFLNWIPLGYIFETNVIGLLIEKFFGVPMFRNVVMKCLTEIGSLNVGSVYDGQFRYLFVGTIQKLMTFLPLEFSLRDAHANGTEEESRFIQDLGLFLSGFMREHIRLLEGQEHQMVLLRAHQYLLNVSEVEDREVFKICLEYWNKLVLDMYTVSPFPSATPLNLSNNEFDRRALYAPVLSKLRLVMINHMAKPEEVLITENDEGEIIRELQKDTDSIALYKSMRECLIYLTHLDYSDMEQIMLDKLAKQIDGSEWSWANINKLCWAIGSISGAMGEEDEKRFLVTVIKELLGLTEMKRGKDNKAVVASNIMYIVGQYPRFLKAHWKFLKTVVNKLFEFMHELHEGVQDMACDTFIKIAQKCRKHFVVYQVGEVVPFIEEILNMMPNIIYDLQPHQVHTFYEAVGYMIQAQSDKAVQERLIVKFMELPNSAWDVTIQMAAQDVNVLRDGEKLKALANVLKTNVSACTAIGHPFVAQLGRIFMDMLNLYKAVSEIIAAEVLQHGAIATKHQLAKSLRVIKKETLKLLDTFISKSEDAKMVSETFVPPMFEIILLDYARNPPQAREPDVLNLMATCIEKLEIFMVDKLPAILDATFECTIQMISRDFQEFPEHRVGFFRFIKAVNACCFAALSKLPPPQFKLIVDSIVWAFKHTMRDIADTGLQIVYDLLGNIQSMQQTNPAAAAAFYQTYFLTLMQDIFVVLTDREHKSGFKMQAMILAHMFHIVDTNQINVPLWIDSQPPTMTNKVFLRNHLIGLFRNAFPHLSPAAIELFVNKSMSLNTDLPAFKSQLRDFLIQLKEFSSQDNQDLYTEEVELALASQRTAELEMALRVPGMIRPQDRPEFNSMD